MNQLSSQPLKTQFTVMCVISFDTFHNEQNGQSAQERRMKSYEKLNRLKAEYAEPGSIDTTFTIKSRGQSHTDNRMINDVQDKYPAYADVLTRPGAIVRGGQQR